MKNDNDSVSMEIERRFLVPIDVAREQAEKNTSYHIEQSYLEDSGEWQVRSRMKLQDGKRSYTLTMKKHVSRGACIEIEQEGSESTHMNFQRMDLKPLKKSRTNITLDSGHTLELDIYHNERLMPGYAIAEVELDSNDDYVSFPSWIGHEITGDQRYSNRALFDRLNRTAG